MCLERRVGYRDSMVDSGEWQADWVRDDMVLELERTGGGGG